MAMDQANLCRRRIGFGLGKLHHVISRSTRTEIVLGALDAGFVHFDLAAAYGDGLCEAEAGRILEGKRHSVTLATKFGINTSDLGARNTSLYFITKALRKSFSRTYGCEYAQRDFSPAAAVTGVENSLRRLRTDYIDFLFFHEPRDRADFDKLPLVIETLDRLKQDGKVRFYGVSARTEQLLSNSQQGFLGDIVQFELSDQSASLVQAIPAGVPTSSFGLIRYLSRHGEARDRLDYGNVLRWFSQSYPETMPILASNRSSEIARLGRAAEGIFI